MGIVSWVSGVKRKYQKQRVLDQELQAIIEMAVDTADPTIRQVGRYRKALREPVMSAMGYCTSLVESIPGPVRLSRSRYYADPLVKAVFVSADQMIDLLQSAVQNELLPKGPNGDEVVALLTMAKTERTIYTHAQQNDMMVGDVAKRTINFIDHRVVALAPSQEMTQKGLEHRAVEVMATVAMEKISTLRSEIAELREHKIHLQSMRRILRGRNHAIDLFAQPSYESKHKIDQLNEQLARLEAELEAAGNKLATPSDALGILTQTMEGISESLVLRQQSLRIDWKNVMLGTRADDEGNDISLAELTLGEDLQRWAVMVKFRPEDVEEG